MTVFEDSVERDGAQYPVQWLHSPDERWERTGVLLGLPESFRDALLAAAQTSPAGHAWRVGAQLAASEVSPAVLRRARTLLARDEVALQSKFMTFIGQDRAGKLELLGAGAVRAWVDESYRSSGYVVLGRIISLPQFRGTGLGTHFTLFFFGSSQSVFGFPAYGCFMGTETEQTRRMCRRAVESGQLDMVRAGSKRWAVLDATFEFEVYLAFYPQMRDTLLTRCADARRRLRPPTAALPLLDRIEQAWREGYDGEEGAKLGAALENGEDALSQLVTEEADYNLYLDFARAARAMGTLLPRSGHMR